MAVVRFECDTCKRTIELPRDPRKLEVIKRCVITKGCHGTLIQTDILENFVRGRPTLPEPGLEDWLPRKALVNYTQTIARPDWTIVHNMGVFPSVQVFIDAPTEVDPDNRIEIIPINIVALNENSIRLEFDRSVSGIAQLIARETDPDVFEPFTVGTPEAVTTFQITAFTQLTIATLRKIDGNVSPTPFVEPTNIDLEITYFPTVGSSVVHTYSADLVPQLESPWSGEDTIVIKGKVYNVRSFDILITPEMTDGTIGNGTTFQFTAINVEGDGARDLAEGEVFILLARSPYSVFDKITDQLIDVTSVTPNNNTFAFGYNEGEMFADPVVIQSIYPLIRPAN